MRYQFHGASFVFGTKGGVDLRASARAQRPSQLLRDIWGLPVKDYDLVINDFEPISAWACKLRRKPCVSLSHQWAVIQPNAPRPTDMDRKGAMVLRRYAPVTAGFGFHFRAYGPGIFTPVIRSEVRALRPTDEGHYTVYLPAYDDAALVAALSLYPEARWQVFSKHNERAFTEGNVSIQPVENGAFLKSMASSKGVLCGAGFEGPAEALFLGKKLMVMPMEGQYEQQCNAEALAQMGATVIKSFSRKYEFHIRHWLISPARVAMDYPDQTADIVAQVVKEYGPGAGASRVLKMETR